MALKKLSLLDLHVAIKNRIESGTNLLVMDHIETNTPAPFAYLEIIGQIERNTKTMFVDRFTIHVHVISAPEGLTVALSRNSLLSTGVPPCDGS